MRELAQGSRGFVFKKHSDILTLTPSKARKTKDGIARTFSLFRPSLGRPWGNGQPYLELSPQAPGVPTLPPAAENIKGRRRAQEVQISWCAALYSVPTPALAKGKLPSSRFTSQYSRGQWCPHLSPHLGQSGGQGLLGVVRAQ